MAGFDAYAQGLQLAGFRNGAFSTVDTTHFLPRLKCLKAPRPKKPKIPGALNAPA